MIEVLARMGGFDICAMTGAYLGAAANKMPVVIDGYISAVAALAAYAFAPAAADYMIASHKSYEKGYSLATETLDLKPFLSLDMRLGEGSGCPIAFSIIRGACDVMADMATFDEAEINDDYLEEIRQEEKYQK
jgi:nicotinate-nucleotide--dimethylbenzimidazole phosphoribosyltransferase